MCGRLWLDGGDLLPGADASGLSTTLEFSGAYDTGCLAVWWHAQCARGHGGSAGLLRLAGTWHCRLMADEVVSHAFSHRFPRSTASGSPPARPRPPGGPASYSGTCETRPRSCRFTAATARTRR